jgi:hypothetical protein
VSAQAGNSVDQQATIFTFAKPISHVRESADFVKTKTHLKMRVRTMVFSDSTARP